MIYGRFILSGQVPSKIDKAPAIWIGLIVD